jgi:hypothetical protein
VAATRSRQPQCRRAHIVPRRPPWSARRECHGCWRPLDGRRRSRAGSPPAKHRCVRRRRPGTRLRCQGTPWQCPTGSNSTHYVGEGWLRARGWLLQIWRATCVPSHPSTGQPCVSSRPHACVHVVRERCRARTRGTAGTQTADCLSFVPASFCQVRAGECCTPLQCVDTPRLHQRGDSLRFRRDASVRCFSYEGVPSMLCHDGIGVV